MWNQIVYKSINLFKTQSTLKVANHLSIIPSHNRILDHLYLGNLLGAQNEEFLKSVKIGAIVNCTVKEEFHPYFFNKSKYRVDVEDSRDRENIAKFRGKLEDSVSFIEDEVKSGKVVYVHCYWGLMRSATVVAAYLIKQYHYTPAEAIAFVKQKRPQALSSLYNYNDLLEEFYQKHCLI
jgi:protein-tyrosine phosphatase